MSSFEINPYTKKQIDTIKVKCMTIKPLVIIKCLAYNHEFFIRDTLEGFVKQNTDFNFVAVIHDDASTDKTAEIIREYAEKFPNIILPIFEKDNQYSKKDGSITRIFKEVSLSCPVKYCAECEGDDYWTDSLKLQKQVDFLENNPKYGMTYTRISRFNQSNKKYISDWGGISEKFEELLKGNTIPTLTAVYRRDLYTQYINEIKPEKKGWLMGDYPLWLYISLKSKIKFFNEVTGRYRILDESASHSKDPLKILYFIQSVHIIQEFFAKYSNSKNLNRITNILIWIQFKIDLYKGSLNIKKKRNAFYSVSNYRYKILILLLSHLPHLLAKKIIAKTVK